MHDTQARPPRIQRRHPYSVLALILFVAGIATPLLSARIFLSLTLPIGIGMALLGVILDRPRHLCPLCGNRVEPSSRLCPACNNQLRPAESNALNVIIALCLVGLVIIGLMLLAQQSR